MLKQFVSVGEEKLSQWTEQVLGNEMLMQRLTQLVQTALGARAGAKKTIRTALGMLSVPTLEDVERIEGKLAEVEALFSEISTELDRLEAERKSP